MKALKLAVSAAAGLSHRLQGTAGGADDGNAVNEAYCLFRADSRARPAAQSPSPAKSKMVTSSPLLARSSTSGWRSVRMASS